MTTAQSKGVALVTGASSGIGKVYAQRLAQRGYDLIVVARNTGRLEELAGQIGRDTGRKVEVLTADLSNHADTKRVAARIEADLAITLVVNNAGSGTEGPVLGADIDRIEAMVELNVVGLNRLAIAAVNAFHARGGGTLVNIASVVTFLADSLLGSYSATKAFVLALTQSLQNEFRDSPIRIQAVLPGVTRTEFFENSGFALDQFPPEAVMSAEDLVDAGLAGLDLGEPVTIPSLPNIADYEAFEAARLALGPGLSLNRPAARYGLGKAAAE